MRKIYKWYRNGKILKETENPDGQKPVKEYFSGNLTKTTTYYNNDEPRIYTIKYHTNERLHRDGDNPSVVLFSYKGYIIQEVYYKNDLLHRDGKNPAVVNYRGGDEKVIESEEFYQHGIRTQLKRYYHNGKLRSVCNYSDGMEFKVSYYVDGSVHLEEFYYMGKRRDFGVRPAITEYKRNGEIAYQAHYTDGVLMSETNTNISPYGARG